MADVKRVLAIGFSQTGQSTAVLESILGPLRASAAIKVTELELEPVEPFPFPWPFWRFFDTFPECVYEEPTPIREPDLAGDADFDLVIFSWQVWFLSPAMPAMAFLQHPKARRALAGKPIVSVIACRNMWLSAYEKFKRHIEYIGGHLVDNVVLTDRAHSAATFVSTPVWVLTGHRGPFLGGLIPAAGVSREDIDAAARFGEAIAHQLPDRERGDYTPMLQGLGAVRVNERMIASDHIAHRSFRIWGALLRALGPPNTPLRRAVLAVYFLFLFILIITVVPISAVLKRLVAPFTRERTARQRRYYAAPSGESTELLDRAA